MAFPGDLQLSFCINRLEVAALKNEADLNAILDEYMSVVRRELKNRIIEDFPKLSGAVEEGGMTQKGPR